MKLAEYLEQNNMTHANFGALIGRTHPTVGRYVKGEIPPADVMMRIIHVTGGAVQPNDFYATQSEAAISLPDEGRAQPP